MNFGLTIACDDFINPSLLLHFEYIIPPKLDDQLFLTPAFLPERKTAEELKKKMHAGGEEEEGAGTQVLYCTVLYCTVLHRFNM